MDPEVLRLLKAHCRIDHDEDDSYLTMLYHAARDYLGGAGIQESDSEKYRLAAFSLVLEWFDGGVTDNLTIGLRSLINQLKNEAVSNQTDPAF